MSPLDASDLEKIHDMVDKAVDRLEMKLDLKADAKEVNERFAATIERRVRIEQNVEKMMNYILGQDEKYRQLIEVNHREEMTEIKETNKQIDEVKRMLSSSQLTEEQKRNAEKSTTIRYIVTVIVGIIIGVGIPLLLKAIGG